MSEKLYSTNPWTSHDLNVWSSKNFNKWVREEDQLPDPIVNEVKVLAESQKGDVLFQKIETKSGQFIRITSIKTRKIHSLTLDI